VQRNPQSTLNIFLVIDGDLRNYAACHPSLYPSFRLGSLPNNHHVRDKLSPPSCTFIVHVVQPLVVWPGVRLRRQAHLSPRLTVSHVVARRDTHVRAGGGFFVDLKAITGECVGRFKKKFF